MAGLTSALRDQLSATVASAAGPYGYTITLGGSTAMATDRLGTPHLLGALLLMTGSVVAFTLLEAIAQGSLMPRARAATDRPPSVLANAHIPSAGTALCCVWAIVHVFHEEAAWALTGFAATLVYFVITALQRIVTDAWRLRREPRAGE